MEEPTRYSDEQLDAAIEALTEPGRLQQALNDVQAAAPELQSILNTALQEGGFFGTVHDDEVRKALASSDPAERDRLVRTILAEETRLGMMIGVAIGMELRTELGDPKES